MLNPKLLVVVIMTIALWAYLTETRRTDERDPGTTTTESHQSGAAEGRILEDRTFGTYEECNDAAKAAVEDLKNKGVSAALASQSPLVESTVYMVYYRGARGQISCRGGRLVNEIVDEQ